MLDTFKAFVASIWTWCLATPTHAMVALAAIGFCSNVAVRFATSKEWSAWCAQHPRVVGLFLIAKGAFPEGGTILRGFLTAVTGELRQRAREALPKPGNDSGNGKPPTPPAVIVSTLALVLLVGISGCAGSLPTVVTAITDGLCALSHFDELAAAERQGWDVFVATAARIALDCGVSKEQIVRAYGAEKASRAHRAAMAAVPACSASVQP